MSVNKARSVGQVIAEVSKNQNNGPMLAKGSTEAMNNEQIVFAGVGKSDKEINVALDNDIFCFNCESIQEIEVINQLAKKAAELKLI